MKRIIYPLICSLLILFTACSSEKDKDNDKESDVSYPFFFPGLYKSPVTDSGYLQEYNHTTNETNPDIGALVGVVMPPVAYSGFDRPSLVTSRSIYRNSETGDSISIDIGEDDLIGAAANNDQILLYGAGEFYLVDGSGSLVKTDAPIDITINKVIGAGDSFYLFTNFGPAVLEQGAGVEWPTAGEASTSGAVSGSLLFVGGDNKVDIYRRSDFSQTATPALSIGAADKLDVGVVRAQVAEVKLPTEIDLVIIGENGTAGYNFDLQSKSKSEVTSEHFASDRVPLSNPRDAARTFDGGFVVTTSGGAYRMIERGSGPEWRVYNQERWLPSEDVRGLLVDAASPTGTIWFATSGGIGKVTSRIINLEEKMDHFIKRVKDRHDRDGAVADSHLPVRGDLDSNIPWDSDNDGTWTSFWLLAECYRYRATGDPEAKANFDKSLDAMLRLRTLTGTDHFVARAAIRKDGCPLDDCDDPDDGEWFTSPDGEWWVKADTSNDEVVAHIFMMGPAYDLCADSEQQDRIREHISGIIGGIMDHGWQLLDLDGEVTTYGQFDPFYVNTYVEGKIGDGGTRSAEILAGLTLAYHMTGEERFLKGKRELMRDHGYDQNAINDYNYEFRKGSGDGDEMSTQAWFALLLYEEDPILRELWTEGWANEWLHLKLQQGAFWNMINVVAGDDEVMLDETVRWLRLAPMDMIRWNLHNSHRNDLIPQPDYYEEGGMRSDGFIIPYDERRCDRWNTDQFRVDGGMGAMIEMDGADVLAPYWMARFYGLIIPAD